MRSDRGVFVVFEGGDGVGKTTQVDRLCSWLTAHAYEVVRTFEPGDTTAGAAIRRIVLDPATGDLSPRAEALLYAADKAHHVYAVVRPALERGAVVVCDRYVDSMLAYQGAGRVLTAVEVEQVARWATEDLRPQLTVVLDVEPGRAVAEKADKDRSGVGRRRIARAGPALLPRARRPGARLLPGAGRPADPGRDHRADPGPAAAAAVGGGWQHRVREPRECGPSWSARRRRSPPCAGPSGANRTR